jgi:hypothetical protein
MAASGFPVRPFRFPPVTPPRRRRLVGVLSSSYDRAPLKPAQLTVNTHPCAAKPVAAGDSPVPLGAVVTDPDGDSRQTELWSSVRAKRQRGQAAHGHGPPASPSTLPRAQQQSRGCAQSGDR